MGWEVMIVGAELAVPPNAGVRPLYGSHAAHEKPGDPGSCKAAREFAGRPLTAVRRGENWALKGRTKFSLAETEGFHFMSDRGGVPWVVSLAGEARCWHETPGAGLEQQSLRSTKFLDQVK